MSQVQWEIGLTEWFIVGTFIASIVFASLYIPFYEWRETVTGRAVTILILAIAGALLRSVLVLWGVVTVTVKPGGKTLQTETMGFWNEFFTWFSVISLGFAGLSIILLIYALFRNLFLNSDNTIICWILHLGKHNGRH